MKQYHYKHFNQKLTINDLNELGAQGYMLVSHTAVLQNNIFGAQLIQYYIFMKELSEDESK